MSAKELVISRLVALNDRIVEGSKEKVVGTMAERFLTAALLK